MSDHPSELDALPLSDLLAAWDEGWEVGDRDRPESTA